MGEPSRIDEFSLTHPDLMGVFIHFEHEQSNRPFLVLRIVVFFALVKFL